MNTKAVVSFALVFVLSLCTGSVPANAQASSPGETVKSGPGAALQAGFHGLNLGMKIDDVKERLKGDMFFRYRGEADVSFLPKQPESVIDCEGNFYVKRGIFRFKDGRLFTIILMLNAEKMDYFTMFTTLEKKYGVPKSFEPSQAIWESDAVRLALEKPLTVKYIDLSAFEDSRQKVEAGKSAEEAARKGFLDQF